jgi:uncharacterized protein YndB with AHSA1/START domain
MGATERTIRKESLVPAPRGQVWQAWTTGEGARTFFAPRAKVNLAIGGPYEMLFDLDAPPGSRGSEGCKVLSYLPQEMLSFSWNAPPRFPELRRERTWVVVDFRPFGSEQSWVGLAHLGWGEGEAWDQVFDYFDQAWDVVLQRLVNRFTRGPIDWSNRPR